MHREAHLIEQWGTGVRRIFDEAKALGLPEPKIEEIGMRLRFTVYLLQPHSVAPTASGEKTGVELEADSESRLESGLESRLESKLAANVVLLLSGKELGKAELAQQLGHKSISGELNKQVKRLLDMGYIERTIPDKPNSRLQKYRLTGKQGEER